jgi:hypothetical protein
MRTFLDRFQAMGIGNNLATLAEPPVVRLRGSPGEAAEWSRSVPGQLWTGADCLAGVRQRTSGPVTLCCGQELPANEGCE